MFDLLTDKLNNVFQRLGSKGRLTEGDVDEALREVRFALLEADVNFRVARQFVNRVRERAVGEDVLQSLTPGQQVVKVVNEEMTDLLTAGSHELVRGPRPPTIVMLVGLQGSGKTTTVAKLGLHLRERGQRSLLVAADLRRPAAVDQLVTLGGQVGLPVYDEGTGSTPVQVAKAGVERGRSQGVDWVLVDTGGRLHIDDDLMVELEEVKQAIQPAEVLLVVDSMTGQDAVNAASEFHRRLDLTGLVLTKLDGDARGGAALSVGSVTGLPIKFIGTGERTDGLEQFFPDRMASRILGMGDVLSLIERAQRTSEEDFSKDLERKVKQGSFDLEDLLKQFQQMKRMGPLEQILEMVPGVRQMRNRASPEDVDEGQLKRMEAIILSMTLEERRQPELLTGSRRRRIAKGSGTRPQDVNQLLSQFREMRKMMKQMSTGKGRRRLMQMLR